jgi:hypothetical protein
MAAHPQPGLTPEQYLAIEGAAEFRSVTGVCDHFGERASHRSVPAACDAWLLSEAVGLKSTIRFKTGDCMMALSDLYAGVIFEE